MVQPSNTRALARPDTLTIQGEVYELHKTLAAADAIENTFGSPLEAMRQVQQFNRKTVAQAILVCGGGKVLNRDVKALADILFGLSMDEKGDVLTALIVYLGSMADGFRPPDDATAGGTDDGDDERETAPGNV
ncbi:hypothetical protein [Roseospira visakhapatnamensis]|uniref:Uncharacterized protein n=1 Tax=Roseospira visakhapatnamensis TaxID=390880 RepID=A0A7W6RBB4_9PROT|nr:hypothetical protein [Roseospira visakhapatnamensis]MBB4265197.1 hypothetical protein [Roseospira visakhapatnamensis]